MSPPGAPARPPSSSSSTSDHKLPGVAEVCRRARPSSPIVWYWEPALMEASMCRDGSHTVSTQARKVTAPSRVSCHLPYGRRLPQSQGRAAASSARLPTVLRCSRS